MLYIVSTPIGNLEDITLRAIRILKEVDIIACEDTRNTGFLLQHFQIKKPLISYHSHSGDLKIDKIISQLKEGKNIALVSDAGTPGISDPGYALIKKVLEENISIVPIPGVSAFLTCLSASGMQSNHFSYYGFLPLKKGRQTLLKKLKEKEHTAIIYESVHRIGKTLTELEETFGPEHEIVVGRELTKKFEEFYRGSLGNAKLHFGKKEKQKGEFVIVF